MELVVFLLVLIVIGLVIGGLARLLVAGSGGLGITATVLAGLGGSFIGGLLVRSVLDSDNEWVALAIAVLCAAALIALMSPRR